MFLIRCSSIKIIIVASLTGRQYIKLLYMCIEITTEMHSKSLNVSIKLELLVSHGLLNVENNYRFDAI